MAMDVNTFACTPKRVKVLVLLPSNELSNKQYNLLFGHMYVTTCRKLEYTTLILNDENIVFFVTS